MKKHSQFIDVLTVISCIGVVFLHANGIFWAHPSGRLWITANIIETLFYYAVPIFFMISGFTLMNYRERYDTLSFFLKRIKRAGTPFIFWSLFSYFFLLSLNKIPEADRSLSGLILSVINCTHFSIYWFFIPLFACYLCMPVLTKIEDKTKIFGYLIVYAFISYSVIPFICSWLHISINPNIQVPIASGYIIFILAGYYFGTVEIQKIWRVLIYLLGLVGLFLHCYMTIKLSPEGAPINGLFKGYLNFPCVLYSFAIFIFCKYTSWQWLYKNNLIFKIFSALKECSLGIYLIHGFFVYYLVPFWGINTASLYYRIGGAVLIVVSSMLITLMIRKVPYLRNVV